MRLHTCSFVTSVQYVIESICGSSLLRSSSPPPDVLAKKVMHLHQKALVYRGIMNRAKAVSDSYERLMHSHQGEREMYQGGGRGECQWLTAVGCDECCMCDKCCQYCQCV